MRIIDILKNYTVIDGYDHPAEVYITDTVGKDVTSIINSAVFAEYLILLGRSSNKLPVEWFRNIIKIALRSHDIVIRDAAVNAIATSESKFCIDILQEHDEKCKWLAEYIDKVIDE